MAGDFLINASGSGDNEIIAAPGPQKFIRVMHYHMTSQAPVISTWKSGSGTTKDICYATTASGGGISAPLYEGGIFDCGINEALILNLSGAVPVGGAGKYVIKGTP